MRLVKIKAMIFKLVIIFGVMFVMVAILLKTERTLEIGRRGASRWPIFCDRNIYIHSARSNSRTRTAIGLRARIQSFGTGFGFGFGLKVEVGIYGYVGLGR